MIDKHGAGKSMYMLWAKVYGDRTGVKNVLAWEDNDADQQAAWVAVAESVMIGVRKGVADAVAAMVEKKR